MNIFLIVKDSIDWLDPFDLLAMNAPADEYDNESLQISRRISVSDSPSEIAAIIADVMQTSFGEQVSPERFLDTAIQICEALVSEYSRLSTERNEHA